MDLTRVDPIPILERLTPQGKCLSARYLKHGIRYELRMTPDGSGIALKWYADCRRGEILFGKNPRLTFLKREGITTVSILYERVIGAIDALIVAEKARLEEEVAVLAQQAVFSNNPLLVDYISGSF